MDILAVYITLLIGIVRSMVLHRECLGAVEVLRTRTRLTDDYRRGGKARKLTVAEEVLPSLMPDKLEPSTPSDWLQCF
jgi:hypothetical protein